MGTITMGIVVKDTKKPFPFDEEKINKIKKTEEGYSILVHGGVNHFDDRACVALFRIMMSGQPISYVRNTIDPIEGNEPAWEHEVTITENADYMSKVAVERRTKYSIICDIGRRYDPENGYFDHHQELDEAHKNYAAFGLLWEYYTTPEMRAYYKEFDHFVHQMDDHDMGVKKSPICDLFRNLNAFNETTGYCDNDESLFEESVQTLTLLFRRMLVNSHINRIEEKKAAINAEIKTVKKESGKELKICILRRFFPAGEAYAAEKECHLVAWKLPENDDRNPNCYHVICVRPDRDSYSTPVRFPAEWAEKENAPEWVKFCHKTGFLAVVDTYEHAIECAQHVVLNEKSDKTFTITLKCPECVKLDDMYNQYMSEFSIMGDYNEGNIRITRFPEPDNMGIYDDTRELTVDIDVKNGVAGNQLISMLGRLFSNQCCEELYDYHDEILEKPAGNFPGMNFGG